MQTILDQNNSTLAFRYNKPPGAFKKLLNNYEVEAVYTNHDYEPALTQRDVEIKPMLLTKGISLVTRKGQVIFEQGEVAKDNGSPYSIFTPFAKKWKAQLNLKNLNTHLSKKLLSKFYRQTPKLLLCFRK